MSLSSEYIEDFDPAAPDGQTDKVDILDNHIRMMKYVLNKQLGSLGQVDLTVDGNEINALAGVLTSGGIQFRDEKAQAGGYASLDGSGDVPLAQIPNTLTGKTATTAGTCTGNSATATAWATARTLTLSGDCSGTSSSIDGTSNIILSVTVANDSHTHDGRYYTESEVNSLLSSKANLASPTFTGNMYIPATTRVTAKGGVLYMDSTSNTGGVVKVQSGGSPSGGSNGDITFIY